MHHRSAGGSPSRQRCEGSHGTLSSTSEIHIEARRRGLDRAEWADPFAREMQRLGVRSGPDTLLDMGLHLWTTMADMSLEDAAETEHRLFLKDPC